MLLDRYRRLLTAYVDGELSGRQRRHIARLLRRSPEARHLLEQLQADARVLRQLPRPSLPVDLTNPVLRNISERRLAPGQRRLAKVHSAPAWMGPLASWAAAAAVLFLLGIASYLYFAASLDQAEKMEMARNQEMQLTAQSHPEELAPPLAAADSADSEPDEQPGATIDQSSALKSPKIAKRRGGKPKPNLPNKPPSPAKEETALTERMEMFPLESVPDLLPVIVKVSDLELEASRKQLIAELHKDGEFRLELPCPNSIKAFDRVQKTAQRLNFGFIIDKQAQERIKSKWRGNYFLYVEDVTPEELTRFLRQVGAEDRKSAAGKPTEAQIDRLVLLRMTARHHKELSTILGLDPSAAVASPSGPLGTDPRMPLADATARKVGQALSGLGTTPRPQSGKTGAQPRQHTALVLAHSSVRPSPISDEIKHFLEERKPARKGTLRILLVLRGG